MKFLLTIIFFLFSSPVFAFSPVLLGGGVPSVGGVVCTGTGIFDGNPGDTEAFEYGADDFCTYIRSGPIDWTITEGSLGIINTYDTAQFKTGTHSLSFEDNDDRYRSTGYIRADIADDGNYSTEFWIRHNLSLSNGERIRIFYGENRPEVYLYRNATILVISARIDTTLYGTYELVTNTWYKIAIDWNSAATSTVKVYDTGLTLRDTLTETAGSVTSTGLVYGVSDGSGAVREAVYKIYIDDIIYNSDGD